MSAVSHQPPAHRPTHTRAISSDGSPSSNSTMAFRPCGDPSSAGSVETTIPLGHGRVQAVWELGASLDPFTTAHGQAPCKRQPRGNSKKRATFNTNVFCRLPISKTPPGAVIFFLLFFFWPSGTVSITIWGCVGPIKFNTS